MKVFKGNHAELTQNEKDIAFLRQIPTANTEVRCDSCGEAREDKAQVHKAMRFLEQHPDGYLYYFGT